MFIISEQVQIVNNLEKMSTFDISQMMCGYQLVTNKWCGGRSPEQRSRRRDLWHCKRAGK